MTLVRGSAYYCACGHERADHAPGARIDDNHALFGACTKCSCREHRRESLAQRVERSQDVPSAAVLEDRQAIAKYVRAIAASRGHLLVASELADEIEHGAHVELAYGK